MVALLSLTCLCIPGSLILTAVTLAMVYALYRSKEDLGNDNIFFGAFIGVVFLAIAQVIHSIHAVYHILEPVMYSPSVRTAVTVFEIVGYIMLFMATQKYFRRFGDI